MNQNTIKSLNKKQEMLYYKKKTKERTHRHIFL
jgi:hypothetical protein